VTLNNASPSGDSLRHRSCRVCHCAERERIDAELIVGRKFFDIERNVNGGGLVKRKAIANHVPHLAAEAQATRNFMLNRNRRRSRRRLTIDTDDGYDALLLSTAGSSYLRAAQLFRQGDEVGASRELQLIEDLLDGVTPKAKRT
jgi:hypothetical protein